MVKNLNSLVVVVTCFIFSCCNTLNASYSKGIYKENSANNCKKETVYIEKNGIVRVDLKNSGASNNEWSSQNILDGYTGSDYLIWRGADNFNTPGNGRLVYTIKIKHSGTYQFVWKSRIGEGDSNTEHNDSWLRISADSFYGEKSSTGQRVYPKGSGKTRTPKVPVKTDG
ncbi:hypothetical protein BWZ22_10230 [Seonamhaeicola sp. S2-3]|uniref:hypothetical protein n=1 Tax=Seonamhaeicola sp. S2-3 TaxID=1936081 RepID=UPI000972A6B0|nr:hypothetical protein [Seonamhaeicola sp. S2-3]APY11594.1 hypothetical protein BWZ22_10230 [Seonamhaeicola sp. S2-3]